MCSRRQTTKEDAVVLMLPSDVIGFSLSCQDAVADLHFALKLGVVEELI